MGRPSLCPRKCQVMWEKEDPRKHENPETRRCPPQCQPPSTKAGVYNPAPKLLLGGASRPERWPLCSPVPLWRPLMRPPGGRGPSGSILNSLAVPGPSEPISLPSQLPPSHDPQGSHPDTPSVLTLHIASSNRTPFVCPSPVWGGLLPSTSSSWRLTQPSHDVRATATKCTLCAGPICVISSVDGRPRL